MAIGTLAPRDVAAVAGALDRDRAPRAWRKLARNPLALAGVVILAVVVGAAIAAPWVAPHDPAKQSLIRRFTPPMWQPGGNPAYPLGIDQVGRDILSRIIHGARISLVVGVSAVVVSLVVGVLFGLLSGFVGGRVDTVIMTVVDITLSFLQLLFALAFVAALGPSLLTIIVVLGLTGWERYARVIRAEVLAMREKDFIEAGRAMGVSGPRMLLVHVLPHRDSRSGAIARCCTATAWRHPRRDSVHVVQLHGASRRQPYRERSDRRNIRYSRRSGRDRADHHAEALTATVIHGSATTRLRSAR